MFSAQAIRPMTRRGVSSWPRASNRPMTAAAPPMSPFISHIPAAGLMEIPPLSKVMPLPTTMSGASSACPAGACSRMIRRGSLAEPAATAANAPMPRETMSSRSSTSQFMSWRRASLRASSAMSSGVRLLAGVLARLRARMTASAWVSPRRAARRGKSGTLASQNRRASQRGSASSGSLDLNALLRHRPSMAAQTISSMVRSTSALKRARPETGRASVSTPSSRQRTAAAPAPLRISSSVSA